MPKTFPSTSWTGSSGSCWDGSVSERVWAGSAVAVTIESTVQPLRCGPSNQPFAATAKSQRKRTHSLRDFAELRCCYNNDCFGLHTPLKVRLMLVSTKLDCLPLAILGRRLACDAVGRCRKHHHGLAFNLTQSTAFQHGPRWCIVLGNKFHRGYRSKLSHGGEGTHRVY